MNTLNLNSIKQNAVLIFIVLVAFSLVLLAVVSYFAYFTTDEEPVEPEKPKGKKSNDSNEESNEKSNNQNNDDLVVKLSMDNEENVMGNNVNSLMMNIQETKARDTGLLSNIADGSYKNFKGEQVFNISNNIFTYDDAKAVCKAHGAELATHAQVMDAYKNGAEWCNYGWSDKQMALYPTQKETWLKLQEDPENSNMCGEWGVNGGYFENPNTLLGANCYGIKPEPKNRERMGAPPLSQKENDILARVARFQQEKNDLTINPFNKEKWSEKN